MNSHKIALLGCGNVGQALMRLLLHKRELLRRECQLDYLITAIATARHGMAINPAGIDEEEALKLLSAGSNLSPLSHRSNTHDAFDFIHNCGADVLFENTPVNYSTGQPAVDYLRATLKCGMHAITANKGPVVHAYGELTRLAAQHGRRFYFESAVMDGAPIFSLFRETLPAAKLNRFYGILNSTTNLVLTRMEGGESFYKAVAYAQSIGIAETDPSGDIDGWDASVKVAALVTVLMGVPLKPSEIDRTGIRGLTSKNIDQAKQLHKRWKLVCKAERTGEAIVARVAPEMVGAENPMYGVSGTSSIITFETDVLPQLSIVEGNPGPETTAYGLLADFINATR
jgi:homoserine dehydrogenase